MAWYTIIDLESKDHTVYAVEATSAEAAQETVTQAFLGKHVSEDKDGRFAVYDLQDNDDASYAEGRPTLDKLIKDIKHSPSKPELFVLELLDRKIFDLELHRVRREFLQEEKEKRLWLLRNNTLGMLKLWESYENDSTQVLCEAIRDEYASSKELHTFSIVSLGNDGDTKGYATKKDVAEAIMTSNLLSTKEKLTYLHALDFDFAF